MKDGVKQIVRIGSRSKSPCLRDANLYDLVNEIDPTKTEKADSYQGHKAIDDAVDSVREKLPKINDPSSDQSVWQHLETNWLHHFVQLIGVDVDDNGFKIVRRTSSGKIKYQLRGGRKYQDQNRPIEVLQTADLLYMSSSERHRLHEY